jgi:hypothetical protein
MTITDTEWIDFMRLIVHKPLEHELKLLLDKYKMVNIKFSCRKNILFLFNQNYFDRVNAPNTNDDTVRSSLCAMVAEVSGNTKSLE